MEKKVSNKIYQATLLVCVFFAILNIAGIWVVWMTGNAFGYATGALLLVNLIACGVLAFLNEKVSIRKQWIVWLICLIVHLIFFILACCLVNSDSDFTVPALFTVMVVAIAAALIYFYLRNKIIMKNKPYNLTPTTSTDLKDQESKSETDLVQKTVQIKVDENQDKTPVANFKVEDIKKLEPTKEDEPEQPTGVITL